MFKQLSTSNKIVLAVSTLILLLSFALGAYIYRISTDQLWAASKCPPSVFGVNKTAFNITYKAVINNLPVDAEKLNLWMPYPQDTRSQLISDIRITSPYPVKINTEPKYGNKILHLEAINPKKEFEVSMEISVVRYEDFSARFIDENVRNLENSSGNFNLYLEDDAEKTFIENISKKALKKGVLGTVLDKAKSIYDYLIDNSSGQNLGDLFESILKNQKIPATKVYGFTFKNVSKTEIDKFNSWTHFFIAGYGWVSADLESAGKFPKEKEYYFGNLDENRIEFVKGQSFDLIPRQNNPQIKQFIYPYAEVDGKEFEVGKKITWKSEL